LLFETLAPGEVIGILRAESLWLPSNTRFKYAFLLAEEWQAHIINRNQIVIQRTIVENPD
jgi:hypothetical protein